MNHPAELQVFSYLQKAMKGEATMTEEVATQVASDVKAALDKQFNSPPRDEFKLRMSNIGRPKCQLWFCLLYTSPSPRDVEESRMPSSA